MQSTTAPSDQVLESALDEILRRARQVPGFDYFPSVHELLELFRGLTKTYPGLITSRVIGHSRLGEPIEMFSVGSPGEDEAAPGEDEAAQGKDEAAPPYLIVGGVHPNEPIGSWTAFHLAEQLCSDVQLRESYGAIWHIIPCVDPDGMRLNEGWFRSLGDRKVYLEHFYRPEPDQQVEWSFPTDHERLKFDRVMPETRAFMAVIDELRPKLCVTLHNSEMGGVYYYLSRQAPELYPMLHEIPRHLGLWLDTGEPESPHLEELAPAIFKMPTIADTYSYFESIGLDPVAAMGGSSSSDYCHQHGTFLMIAELPYWSHAASQDSTPVNESYAAVLARTSTGFLDAHDQLHGALDRARPRLTLRTPFLAAAEAFIPALMDMAHGYAQRAQDPANARCATVAEREGCQLSLESLRTRFGGMLLRALKAERSAGNAPREILGEIDALDGICHAWLAEPSAVDSMETLPISTMVGVQYGAVLAAATHVAGART